MDEERIRRKLRSYRAQLGWHLRRCDYSAGWWRDKIALHNAVRILIVAHEQKDEGR